ncbi:MAG: type-F conjugative transfer system pilin assembly protein TrbC [Oligoflexia bacterium]|nr:type-F conjugative transfer system pilin assembly protein TrbC [Oligoflexia bacterium]
MRSFLTVVIMILFTEVLAGSAFDRDHDYYQEPSKEELMQKQEEIANLFSKASGLRENNDFDQNLQKERRNLKKITISSSHEYQIPDKFLSLKKEVPLAKLGNSVETTRKVDRSPLIFVSLSMPQEELKLLLHEANRVGSAIVLRGFYKDLKSTLAKIKELKLEEGFMIDPTLFNQYAIKQVPAFIIPVDNDHYLKASGSVSLKYFLDLVIRVGTKDEVSIAKRWLAKI